MADETLRLNLDRAFDPGPDFPHPLLLSRTMAILDAEANGIGRGQERRTRPRFSATLPPRSQQLVAAVLVVVLAVAAVAGFFAIKQYSPRPGPVQNRPVGALGAWFL